MSTSSRGHRRHGLSFPSPAPTIASIIPTAEAEEKSLTLSCRPVEVRGGSKRRRERGMLFGIGYTNHHAGTISSVQQRRRASLYRAGQSRCAVAVSDGGEGELFGISYTNHHGHDVVPRQETLWMALRMRLDLVEVLRKSGPPVCKIIGFHKDKYNKDAMEKDRLKNKVHWK